MTDWRVSRDSGVTSALRPAHAPPSTSAFVSLFLLEFVTLREELAPDWNWLTSPSPPPPPLAMPSLPPAITTPTHVLPLPSAVPLASPFPYPMSALPSPVASLPAFIPLRWSEAPLDLIDSVTCSDSSE